MAIGASLVGKLWSPSSSSSLLFRLVFLNDFLLCAHGILKKHRGNSTHGRSKKLWGTGEVWFLRDLTWTRTSLSIQCIFRLPSQHDVDPKTPNGFQGSDGRVLRTSVTDRIFRTCLFLSFVQFSQVDVNFGWYLFAACAGKVVDATVRCIKHGTAHLLSHVHTVAFSAQAQLPLGTALNMVRAQGQEGHVSADQLHSNYPGVVETTWGRDDNHFNR